MSTENSEKFHFDALYTVAEDIYRFAPWESGVAPFFLIDPAHPDAYVLVVMEADHQGTSDIRLILGHTGLRAWMAEQNEEDIDAPFSAEEFVNRYEGYYLEVGYNMTNLNSYEKRQLDGRPLAITFRRQRPGYGLATIVDNRDCAHLERYLRAILRLLTRQLLGELSNTAYRLQRHSPKHLLTAATFLLDEDEPQPGPIFTLSRDGWLERQAPILDEFTAARVKHLPSKGRIMELYYFYLPMMVSAKGALPRAFFLVDLDTGLLEWNDVILTDPDWPEKILRQLVDYFLDIGERPQQLLIQSINTYGTLAADLTRAGITVEYIAHSYVGQELLDSYLQATHIKQHQMLGDPFPRDPY